MRKRVGNYELGKTIGRGKYSKVKYCTELDSKNHFAMKIMSLRDIKKGNMEEQLRREIAIMKMISHDNVVKLYEVLQTSRNIYIVMELVTGGELFEKIMTKEKFPEIIGRKYFQQIIDGVSYCHELGIAHRDLKPENLLVEKGLVKITDFGLSTLANQNQTRQLLMTTCGTPNYVAPEVISKKGYNGFKADIWSCGIILFVMMAGYLPFEDKVIAQLFKKIERGIFKCPKSFGKDLKDLIEKMLKVNPDKRISLKKVKEHKWFKKGYKERKQRVVLPITNQHLQMSISQTKDPLKLKKPEPEVEGVTGSALGENMTNKEPMNAFDLMSQLTMGNISVLQTGTKPPIITRTTRFMIKSGFKATKNILLSVLDRLNSHPKEKRSSNHIIKCFIFGNSQNMITFDVVVIKTVAKNVTFVEFILRRGTNTRFNHFFKETVTELQDLIGDLNIENKLLKKKEQFPPDKPKKKKNEEEVLKNFEMEKKSSVPKIKKRGSI